MMKESQSKKSVTRACFICIIKLTYLVKKELYIDFATDSKILLDFRKAIRITIHQNFYAVSKLNARTDNPLEETICYLIMTKHLRIVYYNMLNG